MRRGQDRLQAEHHARRGGNVVVGIIMHLDQRPLPQLQADAMAGDLAHLLVEPRRGHMARGGADQLGYPHAGTDRVDHDLGRLGRHFGVALVLRAQAAHPDQPQDVRDVAVAGAAAVDEDDVTVADHVVRGRRVDQRVPGPAGDAVHEQRLGPGCRAAAVHGGADDGDEFLFRHTGRGCLQAGPVPGHGRADGAADPLDLQRALQHPERRDQPPRVPGLLPARLPACLPV